jgi:thiol-disulfide isomerase/thioredoxin
MRNKTIFILAALCLFIVSGLIGYFGPDYVRSSRDRALREAFVPPAMPKLLLQDFSAQFANVEAAAEPKYFFDQTMVDLAGKPVRLKQYEGMPVLVNLWATWCLPCVTELPSLKKFKDHYAGKMAVLAVASDATKGPKEIAAFLEKRSVADLGGYIDQGGEIPKNMGIRGIPTSFLIGRNGQILYRFEGDVDWMSPHALAFFDVFLLQNR